MTRHLHHDGAVRKRDMFALAHDAEALFLPHAYRVLLLNAREFRHGLDEDFLVLHRTHNAVALNLSHFGREILGDGLADIGHGFLTRRALRTAPREGVAPHRPTLIRLHQRDAVFHTA